MKLSIRIIRPETNSGPEIVCRAAPDDAAELAAWFLVYATKRGRKMVMEATGTDDELAWFNRAGGGSGMLGINFGEEG